MVAVAVVALCKGFKLARGIAQLRLPPDCSVELAARVSALILHVMIRIAGFETH